MLNVHLLILTKILIIWHGLPIMGVLLHQTIAI